MTPETTETPSAPREAVAPSPAPQAPAPAPREAQKNAREEHRKHGRAMIAKSSDRKRDRQAFDDDAAGYIMRAEPAVGPNVEHEPPYRPEKKAPAPKKSAARKSTTSRSSGRKKGGK